MHFIQINPFFSCFSNLAKTTKKSEKILDQIDEEENVNSPEP